MLEAAEGLNGLGPMSVRTAPGGGAVPSTVLPPAVFALLPGTACTAQRGLSFISPYNLYEEEISLPIRNDEVLHDELHRTGMRQNEDPHSPDPIYNRSSLF